ncbi:methyl-CpG-binding domain-containing protein 11-like [Canna indica]|uniref:Methyl-CpG-binding domain-containing protein 11-like n=1 Tax=Canna indica TaxID=4628 RepID=A0AAQ3L6J8_9LILI|nr:methyl-CpG-binding domain-containing protein 11-like [Canna indica]
MAEVEKGGASTPEKAKGEAEVVTVELPAPAGWTKKFMLNEDGTPRRNDIVFISPTGEEIKNKRQLQQYLKAHPGGPPSSEFDWGTGDTPRRSARIREKAKAVETPEDEKPKKRERKSSSKKGTEEKEDGNGADETSVVKEDVAAEVPADEEMKETGDDVSKAKDEGIAEEVPADEEMKETGDVSKAKDEGIAEGSSLNEAVPAEVALNEDTTIKVVNEGAGKQDGVLESNGSDQNKTEKSSENNGEVTIGVDTISSVPEIEKNKDNELPSASNPEEASAGKEKQDEKSNCEDVVVKKDVPSASCNEQHLPKASPVNC